MTVTFLGLGSNMEDREYNLLQALSHIHGQCRIIDYSSMYVTAPIGYTSQADFLNMIAKVDASSYTPVGLLSFLKGVESRMGRKKTFRWGPRPIDIDILYIEGVTVKTAELTIPHREMFNRLFVLVPLSELTDSLTIDGRQVDIKASICSVTGESEESLSTSVSLYKSKSNFAPYGQN
jgi:2-amino-4-hydroxy-6-hydroxymethyldihydropteridine diphosphokinase